MSLCEVVRRLGAKSDWILIGYRSLIKPTCLRFLTSYNCVVSVLKKVA